MLPIEQKCYLLSTEASVHLEACRANLRGLLINGTPKKRPKPLTKDELEHLMRDKLRTAPPTKKPHEIHGPEKNLYSSMEQAKAIEKHAHYQDLVAFLDHGSIDVSGQVFLPNNVSATNRTLEDLVKTTKECHNDEWAGESCSQKFDRLERKLTIEKDLWRNSKHN